MPIGLVMLAAGSGLAIDLLTGIPILGLAIFVGHKVYEHSCEKNRPTWWAAALGVAGAIWFPAPLFWWWFRPKSR